VVRGDLIVSISGAGNIAVANEENLTFESSSGRVDKIHVRVGDKVSKGDVLAELAPLDTDALELALLRDQISLLQAKMNQDKAQNPYTEQEIEDAEDAVDDAEDDLDFAKDMLRQARAEDDDAAIRQWQSEVYQAQRNLDAAEDRLEEMLEPPDDDSVAIAEMQLVIAERAVAEAEKKLENETITAPWDGVVASIGAEVGDTFYSSAGAGTVIVHLIDSTALELPVQVDEIDIPKIRLNQRAVVSIDALPGVKLEGSVTAISPVPAAKSGVVLYDVTIGLTVPEATDLKIGMSATADILVEKRSNVLLVPTQAIKQDMRGNSIVMIQDGEQLQPRLVVTGLSVGLQTEILEGLSEGEIVVVEIQAEAQPSAEPSGRPPVTPGMPGGGHPEFVPRR